MSRIVFMNENWYFQLDCGDVDTETISEALENFTEKTDVVSLKLDNGSTVVMPRPIMEKTSFFIDDKAIE